MRFLILFLIPINLIAQTTGSLSLQAVVPESTWSQTSNNSLKGGTNGRSPAQILLEPPQGESIELEMNGEIILLTEPTMINSQNWNIKNHSGIPLKVSIINP